LKTGLCKGQTKLSFFLSFVLIGLNLAFLYCVVEQKEILSYSFRPGITVGVVGFFCVILVAVGLTGYYVNIMRKIDEEKKNG
jgi:uncharacterized membrane protein (DUF485 family)